MADLFCPISKIRKSIKMADIEAKTDTVQHQEHSKLDAVPLADRIKQQHADLYVRLWRSTARWGHRPGG